MLGTTLGAADIFKPGSNKLVGQVLSGTPFEAARDDELEGSSTGKGETRLNN